MKSNRMRRLSAILGAALLLSACAATASESGGAETESVRPAFAAEAQGTEPDAVAEAQPDAAASQTDAATDADAQIEGLLEFSNRDLSGAWDAASAVAVQLNGASASCESSSVTVSGSDVTISAAGTYALSGSLNNGSVIVDADKADKVQLVLNGVSINSDDFAAIYVKQADKVFITLADETKNALSNGGTFHADGETNVDGVIFSKDDLTLNGGGQLTISSPAKHGVVSKDDLAITGGAYEITASGHALSGKDGVGIADGTFFVTAGKDGVHSENDDDAQKGNVYLAGGNLTIQAADDGITASGVLQIDGGTLDINASEGLEANYIRVNDGVVKIYAADDGINAAAKSGAYTPAIEINGGEIAVEIGPGDTDGFDANGNLIITGGKIDVTGNSAFDIDGTITFTGGTVTVNGQQTDTIPNQMGGGRGMGRGFNSANGDKRGERGRTPNFDANQRGSRGRRGTEVPDAVTAPTKAMETI